VAQRTHAANAPPVTRVTPPPAFLPAQDTVPVSAQPHQSVQHNPAMRATYHLLGLTLPLPQSSEPCMHGHPQPARVSPPPAAPSAAALQHGSRGAAAHGDMAPPEATLAPPAPLLVRKFTLPVAAASTLTPDRVKAAFNCCNVPYTGITMLRICGRPVEVSTCDLLKRIAHFGGWRKVRSPAAHA
jgi:hypothetical protein